jgi:hypothetical protein
VNAISLLLPLRPELVDEVPQPGDLRLGRSLAAERKRLHGVNQRRRSLITASHALMCDQLFRPPTRKRPRRLNPGLPDATFDPQPLRTPSAIVAYTFRTAQSAVLYTSYPPVTRLCTFPHYVNRGYVHTPHRTNPGCVHTYPAFFAGFTSFATAGRITVLIVSLTTVTRMFGAISTSIS